MTADRPTANPLLKGLKVVEMATWLFGPMSACILSEMGAEVVKVEPHEGDPMRGLIHRLHDGVDWVFEIPNRNKRSVALNVRTPDGIEALRRLLAGRTSYVIAQRLNTLELADVVVVLDEGRITARGRHAELMETSPTYRAICREQLQRESAGGAEGGTA